LSPLFRRSAGPAPSFALRWAADSQQITHQSTGEAPMRWIGDPGRLRWWSRQRWDRERWLNVLFFAVLTAGVAGVSVFLASPQLALRTFVGNGGIGWWDRVGVMPGRAMPESPEELAGPSGLVGAVAQWLQGDALPQAFAGLYETFVAPVSGTEPGSEAPPATGPQPTPPVPWPTTTTSPPAPMPTATDSPAPTPTATDSPAPTASQTSSPSPTHSRPTPTRSPSPSDSPTASPSPSASPTRSPPPSASPTRSPPPSASPTRSPPPSASPSP
jgi:hypothetical protein